MESQPFKFIHKEVICMQNRFPGAGTIGNLDMIRIRSGNEKLKAYFLKTMQTNKEKAVSLLNAENLSFATFYILMPQILDLNVASELIERDKAAVLFCLRILSHADDTPMLNLKTPENGDLYRNTLEWILLSGSKETGLSDEFDRILEAAAVVLLRQYRDTEVLPAVVRMVFYRNRKGMYIQDLVWALFSLKDTRVLSLIADFLKSRNKRDAELAENLLKHASCQGLEQKGRPKYEAYISWFKENSPYLYFTDETFHQTSDPLLCKVNLEAKYLCRKLPQKDEEAVEAFADADRVRLSSFSGLDNQVKAMLAEYSRRLYLRNRRQWNRWMEYPIEKQIEIASGGRGEHND